MNKETLGRSTKEKGKDLQRLLKQRRYVAALWCNQVDAAAAEEVEVKIGAGGGAQTVIPLTCRYHSLVGFFFASWEDCVRWSLRPVLALQIFVGRWDVAGPLVLHR